MAAATGSRYAPASPCDGLDKVVSAPAPCVFIGKPCDVAATAKARRRDPALDRNLGLTIGIFCAGTPTTRGTLEMLEVMGVDPADLTGVRYRGDGWPGQAIATTSKPSESPPALSYEESWGAILQRHRQWRCYVCADHTGEIADIAVGDPWYREIEEGEPGRSLIVVRTERGRRIMHAAVASGAIVAEVVDPQLLPASQPGLERVRGSVGGRITSLRLLGLPAPRFEGMPTVAAWWGALDVRGKLRSTVGTISRVRRKQLRRRRPVVPYRPKGQHD